MRDGPGVLTRNHSRKKEKRIFKDKREALAEFKDLSTSEPLRLIEKGGMSVLLALLRANDTAMPALTPRQLSYWRRCRRSDAMSLPASAYVRTCLSFGSTYRSYPSDSACLPAAPATPALVFVLA